MATAKQVKQTVSETVQREKVVGVTLELSTDEAQFLADIMSCIGGPSDISRRGHADSIYRALKTVGYTWFQGPRDYKGTIAFEAKA